VKQQLPVDTAIDDTLKTETLAGKKEQMMGLEATHKGETLSKELIACGGTCKKEW